ncbi:hypothetical protein FSARC_1717 [Fusarium sarcochroum]|uniref:Uncharacterized protein n=1 Tax=Fusarium sarcochroum TaxID=1208366 RepID=A0A8H4U8H7_9HYPO|nr:hypothetical protein FSARC_1717 [Fusarium sarcochroum]
MTRIPGHEDKTYRHDIPVELITDRAQFDKAISEIYGSTKGRPNWYCGESWYHVSVLTSKEEPKDLKAELENKGVIEKKA